MLRSLHNLEGSTLHASDGEIGRVRQALFDDQTWALRYLVVQTGGWLFGREVLIPPLAIRRIDDDGASLSVDLSREQVKHSPGIDTHKPVARQHEIDHAGYYGDAAYWGGPYMDSTSGHPVLAPIAPAATDRALADHETEVAPEDLHLRSSDEVRGYRIHASDGEIGHVDDFLFDDDDWTIRYLEIDTRNWWPGGKTVLIATESIADIDWIASTVTVALPRDTIRASPAYDAVAGINRDYQAALHAYYRKDRHLRE